MLLLYIVFFHNHISEQDAKFNIVYHNNFAYTYIKGQNKDTLSC